uniref:SFRICE_022792 n=1 Tax=Spodoptera frugiperda TaxID=7108 RepID=A0A2H1X370_SPOFR
MIASWVEWSQLRLPRTRGLGLDFQVGQNITGLLSVFRKFLSRVKNREWSLELCPIYYGNRLITYYMRLLTKMVKTGCTLYSSITCRNGVAEKINRFLISLSSHYSTRTMLCIIDYNLAWCKRYASEKS